MLRRLQDCASASCFARPILGHHRAELSTNSNTPRANSKSTGHARSTFAAITVGAGVVVVVVIFVFVITFIIGFVIIFVSVSIGVIVNIIIAVGVDVVIVAAAAAAAAAGGGGGSDGGDAGGAQALHQNSTKTTPAPSQPNEDCTRLKKAGSRACVISVKMPFSPRDENDQKTERA